ncbi:MAG: heme ABC exporter ATP-binding protein CcmA [Proteobacteria bacterium]|nr:heme ABC exporter ATP-binding protein CcmA [Pseudomonadota bacterium]
MSISDTFETATFSGENLTCRRGGRMVFTQLHFSVAAGGAIVLRGPNGSGKTTLLRLMAGLARPVTGQLKWSGAALEDSDAHGKHLRFIGHLDAIKPAFTVRENLTFWRDFWNTGDASRVVDAMEAFGLAALADFPARLLSAGQRHRLALARLIASPAPLWLLDEPANALDDRSLNALTRTIADHRAKGGMVILASHGADLVSGGTTLALDKFTPTEVMQWDET